MILSNFAFIERNIITGNKINDNWMFIPLIGITTCRENNATKKPKILSMKLLLCITSQIDSE